MNAFTPAPPDNAEIEITTGGTKIGTNSVRASATETHINPQAEGTVIKFELKQKSEAQPYTVYGVRIPFGSVQLEITQGTDSDGKENQATWKQGTRALTAYDARDALGWPEAIATPSLGTYTEVAYQTSIGGAWDNTFALSDLESVAFQTSTP